MIDSHAHLGLCEADDLELVAAARAVGVRRILTVGLDEATNREAIAAAGAHEGVRARVGRHPNSATGFDDAAAAEIEALAADPAVAAVGETGLDFYRDHAPRADQRRAFRAQIEIARRVGKPLVIHVRDGSGRDDDAVAEAFSTLAAEARGGQRRSCTASRLRRSGWRRPPRMAGSCSFAGNLTYPKAEPLREAAALVPDELLLVETDSPFLSPQPVRGKPNEPANVVATAERLAEVRERPTSTWSSSSTPMRPGSSSGEAWAELPGRPEPAGRDRPLLGGRAGRRGPRGRWGEGALTERLARRAGQVWAIELDRGLEGDLERVAATAPNVKLVWGDAMRVDLAGLDPAPTRVVANLPYSIATPLILRTIAELPSVGSWTVLVQREIADRLRAEPGSRTYGGAERDRPARLRGGAAAAGRSRRVQAPAAGGLGAARPAPPRSRRGR